MTRITRRSAIAAVTALAAGSAAAATVAVPATADTADAELLALGRELDRLWAIERAEEAAYIAEHRGHDTAALDAATAASAAIAHKIRDLPATTLAGLRVKAEAFVWSQGGEHVEHDDDATDTRLAAGIVRDIRAMASSNTPRPA